MNEKPTYDELLKYIKQLEAELNRCSQSETALKKKLKAMHATMDLAQKMARIGYWSYDRKSDQRMWSSQMYENFGLDPSLGAPQMADIRKVFDPRDRDIYEKNIEAALAGIPYDQVSRILLPGGETRYIHTQGRPRTDDAGKIIGLFGTSQNITERVLSEKALRESEEKYRRIFENSIVGFFQSTPEGRFIRVNPAFAEMLRYESPEVLLSEIFDIGQQYYVNVEDRHRYQRILRREGKVDGFEFKARCKDGTEIWVTNSTRAYFDDQGRVICYEGTVSDITTRKLAEEALRESEERFRKLLNDIAMVSVQGYRPDGTVFFWNEGSRMLYGFTSEEAVGRNILNLIIPPEMREPMAAAIKQMATTGTPETASELELMHKDGSRLPVYSCHCILEGPGNTSELYSIDINLSAVKNAERERERLKEQLIQSQKMESVGRLAGGVAHDFNNMLGVILGHTELCLLDTLPGQPLHTALTEIRKAAERSAKLTQQLLAFARKQTVVPQVLDLNATVTGMLDMLRRLIGENIELVWRPGSRLGPVNMDPSQIDQVLANLCINARDAIGDTGTVTIETAPSHFDIDDCASDTERVPGEHVLLKVGDNGCGMEREVLKNLFDPFFTTKETGKGTGLGLATVYGIIKQNSGFIDVDSDPGKGTVISIYLPVHAAGSIQATGKDDSTKAAPGRETILVVEDEPMILNVITDMLQQLGYTVLAAKTPGLATRLARDHAGEIDLLVTDVIMPEMNGRDLARNLQSLYPDLKRLFMSGYTADVIAHHGVLDAGVHFIQKPFLKNDLARKVRHVLDGTREG